MQETGNPEKWVQVFGDTLAVWTGIGFKVVIINQNQFQLAQQQATLQEMLSAYSTILSRKDD